jgi:uncharacterized integral membrane protein (TIGR00698 family)
MFGVHPRVTLGPVLLVGGVASAAWYPQYPGFSLVAGFALAGVISATIKQRLPRFSKPLLGWAIVALGLTVSIPVIADLTAQYLMITAIAVAIALMAALLGARAFNIDRTTAALIGAGTAICGASAIVAVSGAVKARAEQTSIALGVVLIFNALALLLFPALGSMLHLDPQVFAAWAGLAIHDTSSVVAATLAYAPGEVWYATTVKLARAIWIIPVVLFLARVLGGEHASSARLPWFLWGYIAAAGFASWVDVASLAPFITAIARAFFSVGLFLTGASVDVRALIALGGRPLGLGLALWLLSSVVSLGWLLF